ncbi:hypothetical protein MTR_3g435700 [Medicago truncatula]|uniref:Uncharacterized protein n=1 Tax=Medicago truncatula TaxID=3880 RepID=A0A072UVC8_MEDTR|nr:hypothetical protein MTR_3g435700 [Medicago truncatula]
MLTGVNEHVKPLLEVIPQKAIHKLSEYLSFQVRNIAKELVDAFDLSCCAISAGLFECYSIISYTFVKFEPLHFFCLISSCIFNDASENLILHNPGLVDHLSALVFCKLMSKLDDCASISFKLRVESSSGNKHGRVIIEHDRALLKNNKSKDEHGEHSRTTI